MARFDKGDIVVATSDLGGFLRDSVPKGTKGVVTESGWGSLRVLFTIDHGWFSSRRQVEISVSTDEIA